MQLCVSGGGLKATTKDHGLTEYWANRLTYCSAPVHFPRIFCWVYRHEGRRLRHELRCHAVLCASSVIAKRLEEQLRHSLALALAEFKRDKLSRQNARLSLVNSVYDNPTIPRRKILLSTGSHNYRPPLERCKSAPKLTIIEENLEEAEEIFEGRSRSRMNPQFLRHESMSSLLIQKHSLYDCKNNIFECKHNVFACKNNYDCKSSYDCENSYDFKNSEFNCNTNVYDCKPNICNCKTNVPDDNYENDIQERLPTVKFTDSFDIEDVEIPEFGSLQTEIMNACNVNGWLRSLSDNQELSPVDGDDGSLSSGCESASTATSDLDQVPFSTIVEDEEETRVPEVEEKPVENKKTELDFKVGSCVLNHIRNFEKLAGGDIRKFCGLRTLNGAVLENDEVSLVPLGELETDFSSLKVYKKRSNSDSGHTNINKYNVINNIENEGDREDDEENGSACSDESGYDEVIDCTSSIGNVVLV